MKKYSNVKVLLTDGIDRQTLPLAKAFHDLGCHVTTLNQSKLDNGYTTRFADERLLNKTIALGKEQHAKVIYKLINTGKYDVVVTTSDDTAEKLSLMKEDVTDKTSIAVNNPELFYMAYDKNKTMKVCMDENIPCPKTFFDIESIEQLSDIDFVFPLVVKPRMSFGAIGYHKVENFDELIKLCEKIGKDLKHYVFQEYIPQSDIQYECAMFIDDMNEVKTACVFSKNRWFPVEGGSSTCNVTVTRPDIIASCKKLLQSINWRGAADIDLIQDPRDSIAKIMEINPRVSGSIKIVLNAGVDIAEQILDLALGNHVADYTDYLIDRRLRCIHTDFLWFLKSSNRFHSTPSWFSWHNTKDQIWSLSDPLPFFAYSIQSLMRYKKEMKKRRV